MAMGEIVLVLRSKRFQGRLSERLDFEDESRGRFRRNFFDGPAVGFNDSAPPVINPQSAIRNPQFFFRL